MSYDRPLGELFGRYGQDAISLDSTPVTPYDTVLVDEHDKLQFSRSVLEGRVAFEGINAIIDHPAGGSPVVFMKGDSVRVYGNLDLS